MKNISEYFKTLVQVKRNGAAHLLDLLKEQEKQNPEHINKLEGQVEAYNNVLHDIDGYQQMAMERVNPSRDIARKDPMMDVHKTTPADH